MNERTSDHEANASPETKIVFRLCPSCGHNNDGSEKISYCPDTWGMTACGACGFVYLEKGVIYEELASNLAWEITSKTREKQRTEARPVSSKLKALTRKRLHLLPRKNAMELVNRYALPGPVVDLGCGNGSLASDLGDGFVPIGIEISERLAQEADASFKELGGHAINAPGLAGLQTFPDDYFSAATLRSYLEHELKPKEVLKELFRCTVKGGIAVIKVPNYGSVNRMVTGSRWCGLRFPDHLNYFTPSSLRKMAVDCGFQIRRFTFLDRLPTSDNMGMIIEK